ncbi:MAG TPA: flagellar hook-associated protein FlgK [Dissulfurispiraceae bacterium]|nr:flagellar hook-associated protein FlgK [Dissulfurispiraceae bacterium]
MSILGILNIGTTALLTAKSALNTTSNNIANASTPGYTRQSAVLASVPSGLTSMTGTSGNGVTISDIERMYDSFTTLQLRNEKSTSSYWNTYSNYAGSIETVFNETSDTGIGPAISSFFSAWQQVAQDPGNTVQRTALINAGQYLASRINSAYNTMADQQGQIYRNSQDLVTQVNNISQQIYSLNEKIVASPGALDLKDQRDALVEQLNEITRVDTVQDGGGRYAIYLGGTALVDPSGSYSMSVALDTSNAMQFSVGSANINSLMTSGSLRANLDARDTTIAGYIGQLNTFAAGLGNAVNNQQALGFDLNGNLGGNFFSTTAGFDARDLRVTITDPRLIAASGTAAGVPGNNTNAQAIADMANSGVAQLGGITPIEYYSRLVAATGADAQSANTYIKFQTALVSQLETQRQSVSGVSLDEEAVNLVQYQKSFEAAAKLISTGNDLLETIIGMVK